MSYVPGWLPWAHTNWDNELQMQSRLFSFISLISEPTDLAKDVFAIEDSDTDVVKSEGLVIWFQGKASGSVA